MSAEIEIDAELREAAEHSIDPQGAKTFLTGHIYGDRKLRFSDGCWITTSEVQRWEGDVAFTRNSIYRVKWRESTAALDEAHKRAVEP